jgi:leader peptidase (prepilin peptidase) / N-methyltransferase
MRGKALFRIMLAALGIGISLAASPNLNGAFGGALALLMLAIAISDAREFIIPDVYTATAFALGVISAGLFAHETAGAAALTSLLRAAATALPFLTLMLLHEWWRGRRGLGLGDVKLAAVAGVWLDWFTIVAVIEVAALAALVAYGVWRFVLHRPIAATTPLPFGLFLAPVIWGGWIAEAIFFPR